MDLYEVNEGSVGLIYWYVKITKELAESEIQKIRQQSISNTLNSTLTNMMYEPSKAINSMEGVIRRGWDDAKQTIDMLENGTGIHSEYVMIDSNIKSTIEEIESNSNFMNWMNPYLIDEIKKLDI